MTFAAVVAGVLTTARQSTRLSSALVTYEDYQILNHGTDTAVVVSCTGFSQERSAHDGSHWCDWNFELKQYTPYTDLPATVIARDLDREALLAAFRKYPQLGGVAEVHEANIASGFPDEEPKAIGNVTFLVDTFSLAVREDVSGTEVE